MTKDEKGMTKDEMVGWHHRLTGHNSPELETTQFSLADPWVSEEGTANYGRPSVIETEELNLTGVMQSESPDAKATFVGFYLYDILEKAK